MRRSGGVVILMQQTLKHNTEALENIEFLLGNAQVLYELQAQPARPPFDDTIIQFLDTVSKILLKNPTAKSYPDVITFGFWCRKASIQELKNTYGINLYHRLGRGTVFHIAPSNVPVNFAYSMVAGMLAGNHNICRVPSKDFEQVDLIIDAFKQAKEQYDDSPILICLRYGHDPQVNQQLTNLADTRVIWGGNQTIATVRKATLNPRANEITFADRFSLVVIEAEDYLKSKNKENIAVAFYNDTYLTDQNACTSPRFVIWLGNNKEEAKEIFWSTLHHLVKKRYPIQPVQAVSKREAFLEFVAGCSSARLLPMPDNRIVRVQVKALSEEVLKHRYNSGYFIEYDAAAIEEIFPICNSLECQTLSYYGSIEKELRDFVFAARPKGIDRIVPMGTTMDFGLVWDGVDLIETMSREVSG